MARAKSIILKAYKAIKTWFMGLRKMKRKRGRIRFSPSTIWRDMEKNCKIDKISINPYVNYLNLFKKYCERYLEGQLQLSDRRAEECLLCKKQLEQLLLSSNDQKVLLKLAQKNWNSMTEIQKEPFTALAEKKRNWLQKKPTNKKFRNISKRFEAYARLDKTIAPAGFKKHFKNEQQNERNLNKKIPKPKIKKNRAIVKKPKNKKANRKKASPKKATHFQHPVVTAEVSGDENEIGKIAAFEYTRIFSPTGTKPNQQNGRKKFKFEESPNTKDEVLVAQHKQNEKQKGRRKGCKTDLNHFIRSPNMVTYDFPKDAHEKLRKRKNSLKYILQVPISQYRSVQPKKRQRAKRAILAANQESKDTKNMKPVDVSTKILSTPKQRKIVKN